MWQPRAPRFDSAIESPLGMARPWTPPDTDTDPDGSTARHDYFSDPYRPPQGDYVSVTEPRWQHRGSAKEEDHRVAAVGVRCDSPTEADHVQHQRPQPKSVATAPVAAPYTPTKSPQLQHGLSYGNAQAHGLPRYPYTPDSTYIVRRSTERTLSPIPWDTYSSQSSSPIQNALSSCIAHFENLLQTREPDEDQMEYIVGQFEAMASYLSAPDAQSQSSDEQSVTEWENGLGTTKANGKDKVEKEMNEEYIAEVGRYIEGVRGYVNDLKLRLDEVKMLNSIQLDVIQDLRSQMQNVKVGIETLRTGEALPQDLMQHYSANTYPHHNEDRHQVREFGTDSTATLINPSLPSSQILPSKQTPTPPKPPSPSPSPSTPTSTHYHVTSDTSLPATQYPHRKIITIIHTPPVRSFWSSFAEALDQFGAMFYEHD
ncbi:hypothetical protein J1614_004922 [Plenodomus biglobosus]|nr:hypothetical protein J1614_004922 [Plenodomus biglobosus]